MRGDLHVAALMQPAIHPLGLGAQHGVALGMRDDGRQSHEMQAVHGVVHGRRNGKIRELHEQIILLVDRVLLRIFLEVLQVLKIQMKIASRRQFQAVADGGLKLVTPLADDFRIEFVMRIGVRRSDHVRDAVRDGHFRHLNGCFQRVRAVVQAGKNVAMNVDHIHSASSEDTRTGGANNPSE